MFSRIVGLLPVASVSALVVVAIFNLGYFWKIGLHFLGLIDLSNLAYSLGLALSSTLFLSQLVFILVMKFEGAFSPEKERNYRKRANLLLVIGGSMVVATFFTAQFLNLPSMAEEFLSFFGFVTGGMGILFKLMINYKKGNKQDPKLLGLMLLATFGIIFGAGMVACEFELHDKKIYQVTTKSRTIENARILRSSSSGFILAVDGIVNFVPQSEISGIVALTRLK